MALTRVERERVTDSKLKIQSVTNSLKDVDPSKIPEIAEIEQCLEDASRSLHRALRDD